MEQNSFQLPDVRVSKTVGLEAHGELAIIQDSAAYWLSLNGSLTLHIIQVWVLK